MDNQTLYNTKFTRMCPQCTGSGIAWGFHVCGVCGGSGWIEVDPAAAIWPNPVDIYVQTNVTAAPPERYEKWAGKRWDVWVSWNPWFSVGVHIDHRDPSVTLHLPGFILAFGRMGIMTGWSLRRGKSPVEEVS